MKMPTTEAYTKDPDEVASHSDCKTRGADESPIGAAQSDNEARRPLLTDRQEIESSSW